MGARICAVGACVAGVMFALAAHAEDTVFRCGRESVSVGDSKYMVQKVCGKPSRTDAGTAPKKKKASGKSSSSEGKTQKWVYDRGYGDFVYVLTFEKDLLRKVEKTGRSR